MIPVIKVGCGRYYLVLADEDYLVRFQPKDAHTAVTQTGIQPDGTVGQILETVFIINSDPTKQDC